MKILVGFEESGVVRDAFRARGHDAWSCDLQRSRSENNHHYQCDIFLALDFKQWDLIILHPECTALTVAGNHVYAKGKPKYAERLAAIRFIDELWLRATKKCKKVCLENPQGVIHTNTDLPKPQYVHPHQFGHDASKKTGLTLKGLPPLAPTKDIPPRWVCCGMVLDVDELGKYGCPNCCGDNKPLPRWANQTDSGQNRLAPSPTRARDRAETYAGIADAKADQWGNL